MSLSNEDAAAYTYSSDMAAGIRVRTGLIMLISSASVALAFGMSFYFALVSNQTAIARQFPELSPIVERLKSLLVVNTFGFVAVVIASFWVLSRLVTRRMFTPLGSIMKEMRRASENKLPQQQESHGEGPFGDFARQWEILLKTLRENEEHDVDALRKSIEALTAPGCEQAVRMLREMLEKKERRLSSGARQPRPDDAAASGSSDDALFMQPV